MTARTAAGALAATLAVILGGCVSPSGVFHCQGAADCTYQGTAGFCEATGYCSFPDATCPSTRRYGAYAGDQLGGACVGGSSDAAVPDAADADAPTPPEDGPPPDSPAQSDAPQTDAPQSDAPPDSPPDGPFCGNDDCEPGETCSTCPDDCNVCDTAQYNFETTSQNWAISGSPPVTAVSRSNVRAYAGSYSLQVNIDLSTVGSGSTVVTASPLPSAGQVVTFHLYVPTTATLDGLMVYVKEGAPGYRFTGPWVPAGNLVLGWNTLTVTVPGDAVTVYQLGVQFNSLGGGASGSLFYIDSVSW